MFSLALLVPLVAAVALVVPGAAELLELDRSRLLAGELWRLASGHLAHYSFEHWLLDSLAFLALALTCARQAPRRTVATLALAGLMIPLAVLTLLPEMERYRGLSGLDSALFGLCLAHEMRSPGARRVLVAGTLFVAKLSFELFTGRAVFVDSIALGFTPVPLAHALGALVGLAFGLLPALAGDRSVQDRPSSLSPSRSSGSPRGVAYRADRA